MLEKWNSCIEALPEDGGPYIVFIHAPLFDDESETYVNMATNEYGNTEVMWFDNYQKLWKSIQTDDGHSVTFNAVLSAVNTNADYHVSHWASFPVSPFDRRWEE